MNDAWGYAEENDPQNQDPNNGPKPLRDAYQAQKKQNQELMARLEALEAQQKQTSVADLMSAAGADRSAAKYYQGDATPDAVTSWLTEMRSAVGAPSAPEAPTPDPGMNPDQLEQYRRMTEAGQQGVPQGNTEAMASAVASADNLESLLAAFNQFQR